MSCIEVMPKLGLTMKEGTIEAWHKKEGEEVKKGEVIFDVTTDKLTNEIEAKESGVLRKILVHEGETVECRVPVAIIAGKDEDISDMLKQAGSANSETEEPKESEKYKQQEVTKKSEPVKREGRVRISPIARRIAKENGVDYTIITGTGPEGRIVKKDIEEYINSNKVKVSPAAFKLAKELNVDISQIEKDGRIMKEDVLAAANAGEVHEKVDVEEAVIGDHREKVVNMSPMRKVIAKRMSESVSISPTVTYNMTIDTSQLKRFKDHLKDIFKVTYTDLLIKIVSVVLKEFPLANCSVSDDKFILKNYVNMGVAVALDEGLIVPVIKDSDVKGLKQITTELKELIKKAKSNQLSPDDMAGATFTLTNLGMFDIDTFSPIINQPEVAILGVNKITKTPIVEDVNIVIRPLMKLSFTADHRAVDGAYAAQFLQKIKQYVEKPELLLL